MIRRTLALSSITIGLMMSGCSSITVDPSSLRNEMQLPLSASNPSPAGASASKVVIFEVDTSKSATAKQAEAGAPVQFELDRYINEAGAELVDRNLAATLKDEVIRAEMGGAGVYTGAPVADYAIRTTITQANFGSQFKEQSSWVDKKGKYHVTPASCNYSGAVSITVDVYTVPELKRVKSILGSGSASASEDARNSNCNGGGAALVRSASKDAVYDIQEELKEFFAPVGYVLNGYEIDGGKFILKTSLTPAFGAQAGKSVYITSVTAGGDRYPMGKGKIVEPVVASGAFVLVDKELISKVSIGDEVRVDHSCSFLGCQLGQTLDQSLGLKL